MKIFDERGVERERAWLEATFGPVVIHPANAGPGWRLAEIRADREIPLDDNVTVTEAISPMVAATIMVKLLAGDGRPAVDMPVAWYWPNAPENPGAMPVNGLPPGMVWGRADRPGLTNLNGDVGLAMGPGAYYYPPNIGPHASWVWGANSDVVLGLGMLGGTNHDHINLVFRQTVEEPPEEPEVPVAEVLARVEIIERQCAEVRKLLGGAVPVRDQ